MRPLWTAPVSSYSSTSSVESNPAASLAKQVQPLSRREKATACAATSRARRHRCMITCTTNFCQPSSRTEWQSHYNAVFRKIHVSSDCALQVCIIAELEETKRLYRCALPAVAIYRRLCNVCRLCNAWRFGMFLYKQCCAATSKQRFAAPCALARNVATAGLRQKCYVLFMCLSCAWQMLSVTKQAEGRPVQDQGGAEGHHAAVAVAAAAAGRRRCGGGQSGRQDAGEDPGDHAERPPGAQCRAGCRPGAAGALPSQSSAAGNSRWLTELSYVVVCWCSAFSSLQPKACKQAIIHQRRHLTSTSAGISLSDAECVCVMCRQRRNSSTCGAAAMRQQSGGIKMAAGVLD